jgi:hypothetical protein
MQAYKAEGAVVLVIEEADWQAGASIEVAGHRLVMDPPAPDQVWKDELEELEFVFLPAADKGIALLTEAEEDENEYRRRTLALLHETRKEDPEPIPVEVMRAGWVDLQTDEVVHYVDEDTGEHKMEDEV